MKYDPRLLLNYYARLAPRERLLLGLAAVSMVLVSLYVFAWEPLQTGRELLARRIAAKEKDLVDIQKQREVYLDLLLHLEANQAAIESSDSNFNLFSYVQNTITQAVSRERITSMNPTNRNIGNDFQEQLVEIKLTQISLPQLVDLLHRVEKGDHPLRFSRLQVKKRLNDIYNFDVTATVSLLKALEPKAGDS